MMSRLALLVARRIIRQLQRDHRTFAMVLIVPLVVMTLIGLSFPQKNVLDYIAPALLAALGLFFGFLLTGISFLRERSQGTMERLMVSPISRLDIVLGYLAGFFVIALVQSALILFFVIYILDVRYNGSLWQIFLFQMIVVAGAVNLGIFISTFARNEFQVVQFIPLVILPQMFLCGLLWPVEQMPDYLQWLSNVLPLTYAVRGMRDIMLNGSSLLDTGLEVLVLLGFAAVMSAAAALTLRRSAAG